ncbi:HEAT repeat domain-containing protein [Sphingosinicella terrae]|uniref:HEAT repeat domain-containing protein n=1 Tax=Sphingosinicella terrae TaxID=2172047 RepID=UPI000E0CE684|nr:HEAT repeat domain-containing protein [Sphingosinicella terrae]
MIAGTALARWLADGAAQDASFAGLDAVARRWSAHPLMAGLERDLIDMRDRTPERLIAAARRFMDRGDDVEALMADLIASCRTDPFFRPPFQPISTEVQNSLLLYHHPDLSISLGVTGLDALAAKKSGRTGAASINFTGCLTLLRFIHAGGAIVSLWEAPPVPGTFTFAAAGACRLVERRRIADGEELLVDGRQQSFVIEHAEADILFFHAVARTGCAPVALEYDSDSLACIGATGTDEAGARLQMMASLLRALDRQDALPVLREALASPHFFIRWHVMREMLALDAEGSLPSLRRLAETDPHPDVRAAARQTLDLFFADEEAPVPAPAGEGQACPA